MTGLTGRRRKPVRAARAQDNDTMTLERDMDRLATDAMVGRLAELERIHDDMAGRHAQSASDHRALLDALHARSPQEWHQGDPATSALAYLRHLEDEADRCGIDRRPPWSRDTRPGDERVFRSLAAELGAEAQFGLPVPPAAPAAPGTGSEGREEETAAPPPGAAEPSSRPGDGTTADSGSGPAPPVGEAAETTPAPAGPEPVSTEDGPVQDEPDAEPDCGETGDVA